MKRFFTIFVASIAIVSLVAISASAFPAEQKINPIDQAKSWAHIDSAPSTINDEIAMQGDSIIVYADEMNRIAARYAASGVNDGEQRAKDYILRREALYNAGINAGFAASEDEVQDIINTELEWEKDADGQEYFQAYLDEAGLTAAEYWDTQRDKIRKEIVIGKYLDAEREKNNITDPDEWNNYESALVQQLISADHVTSVTK